MTKLDIEVRDLTLKYHGVTAIDGLDLTVPDGESLVLLGESGCGKTSTMRCIAGLETPSGGVIRIGDDVVFDSAAGRSRPPHKRRVGMVFQSYAIWPHLTVFENVAFPLVMERVKRAEIAARVGEVLELVGLAAFAQRGASLLSGGQMQRVALARSLVMRPAVMLLDEPLSNLDARLRERLRFELRELQQRLGLTSIYVTHDQDEALALADRIALMAGGRIVQIGAPDEIYRNPSTASVAEFLGVANILPAHAVSASAVQVPGLGAVLVDTAAPAASDLRLCVRAEDLALLDQPARGDNAFDVEVVSAGYQGPTIRYRVRVDGGAELQLVAPASAAKIESGRRASVVIDRAAARIVPAGVAA